MEADKSDSFRLLSECPLPTEVGNCMLRIYGDGTCTPWPVCVFGEVHGKSAVSVRLHDACMTSELFASVKCDCALQLRLAQSQPPLPAVPDPDLQEDSVDGVLPRIGPEGQQPWQVYARPFEGEEGRPRIAIVFGALGLDSSGTVRAIEDLPGQVSLSLSPYASSLQDWVAQARSKGHEVLLSLPVQPLGYPASDPGPHALLATQNASEMVSRLRWSLARAGGYVGLSTGIESPVITDARTAEPLLGAVKERGLLFFDGSAASTVTAAELARRDGVPFAAADLVIDATLTPAGIDDALARLESLARQNGQAIGFARAYPISLDRVAGWALSLEAKGISLAPLTALIATPESG